MNLGLLLRRLVTIDLRRLPKTLPPTSIDVLLYVGKSSVKMYPHCLLSSSSIQVFSRKHPSGVAQIDRKLTPYNLAYVIFESEKIVHQSWVSFDTPLPSQFGFDSHFPVIGHCYTSPSHRGKSIYSSVLNYILQDLRSRNISHNAYILVSPQNESSIKGIEKSDFEPVARLRGLRILGGLFINKSTTRLTRAVSTDSLPDTFSTPTL